MTIKNNSKNNGENFCTSAPSAGAVFYAFFHPVLLFLFFILFSLLLPNNSHAKEWQLTFKGDQLMDTAENQQILMRLPSIISLYPVGTEPRLRFYFHDKRLMMRRWQNLVQKVPQLAYYKPEIFNTKQEDTLSIQVLHSLVVKEPCPAKVRIIDPNLPISGQGMLVYGSANLKVSEAATLAIEGEENTPIRLFQMKNSYNMVVLNSNNKKWTFNADNLNYDLYLEEDRPITVAYSKSISANPVAINALSNNDENKKCRLQFNIIPLGKKYLY